MVGHFMRGLLGDCCHARCHLRVHATWARLWCRVESGPTFDMSNGSKGAKRPLERPLDGAVRCHLMLLTEFVSLRRV